METNYIIYKVENKQDGKVFIGRTKMTLDQVKKQHWGTYNYRIKHELPLSKLYQAFKRNQWDSFEWTVIDTTVDLELAKQLWKQYVEEYDAYEGYNSQNGFKLGHEPSEEFKQHMSKVMMGKNAHENSHNAVLTEEEVAYIRHMYSTYNDITLKALANEYGVTPSNISAIVNYKTWQYM